MDGRATEGADGALPADTASAQKGLARGSSLRPAPAPAAAGGNSGAALLEEPHTTVFYKQMRFKQKMAARTRGGAGQRGAAFSEGEGLRTPTSDDAVLSTLGAPGPLGHVPGDRLCIL